MNLPAYVIKALNLLEQNHFIAVVVGGAVRDYLLGIEPTDYDISTSATPDEVITIFSHFYVLDFGKKHGTITVFLDHHQIEITTFRVESGYEDFRHPNKTQFVRSLEQDVLRRDFTINAICFYQDYIDLVGGRSDLNKKIIRAIGNPQERFYEDPLRIMRALRFASTLGFEIEQKTKQAIFNLTHIVRMVSIERIREEFNRLLLGKFSSLVFLEYGNQLMAIISPTIDFDFVQINKRLPLVNGLSAKLAAIFFELSKEEMKKELKSLKYSKEEIKKVMKYWEADRLVFPIDRYHLGKLLGQYESKDLHEMIDFAQTKNNSLYKSVHYLETKILLDQLIETDHCFHVSDLAIDGNDLIELGIKNGKKINLILNQMLDEILQGKLENKKEALKKHALFWYQERR